MRLLRLVQPVPQQQQSAHDDSQCGQQHIVRSHQGEADEGDDRAQQGGQVLFVGLPLVYSDDHEQGGHGKVDAGGINGEEGSRYCTDHRTENPIGVVQQSDGEVEAAGFHPGGDLYRAEQGVGLIGEGEDHIEFSQPHAPEFLQHGQAIH